MSGKHTPGPWAAREYISPAASWFVRGPENENVTGQAGGKMSEVDARLIAAAPEMLEALIECRDAEMRRRKKLKSGAPATTYCEERLARINAAIAKATSQ